MYTDIYTCIYHCTKCTVCRATDVMPPHIFFEAIAGPLCFEITIQIDEKYFE